MSKRKPPGITLQCIRCKSTQLLSFDQAAGISMPGPFCIKCAMPMVAIEART